MCFMYYTYNMQAQYRIANKHIIKINSKKNIKKNTTKDFQLKCIYVLCLTLSDPGYFRQLTIRGGI